MSIAGGRQKAERGDATNGPSVAMLTRVAVVASVLALIFGGVAFGGALPGPLRSAVATFAHHVGIDVPWDRGETVKDDHGQDAGAGGVGHGENDGAPGRDADNAGHTGGDSSVDKNGQGGGNADADEPGQGGGDSGADEPDQGGGNSGANKPGPGGGNPGANNPGQDGGNTGAHNPGQDGGKKSDEADDLD